MDINQEFGRNVKRLRLLKGSSQEQFATIAGVHRTYVSDIERGLKSPTLWTVDKVATALGVTPSELLEGCGTNGWRPLPDLTPFD